MNKIKIFLTTIALFSLSVCFCFADTKVVDKLTPGAFKTPHGTFKYYVEGKVGDSKMTYFANDPFYIGSDGDLRVQGQYYVYTNLSEMSDTATYKTYQFSSGFCTWYHYLKDTKSNIQGIGEYSVPQPVEKILEMVTVLLPVIATTGCLVLSLMLSPRLVKRLLIFLR